MIILIYSAVVTLILILFIFYIRYLLKQLFFFAENIDNLREEVQEYSIHLKSLYEMTIYHGDETIEGLIGHTTHVLGKIEAFDEFYTLLSSQNTDMEEEYSDQEENTTQEEI